MSFPLPAAEPASGTAAADAVAGATAAAAADATARFEQHRGHLFGVAYRMLGSAAEAEDVVQEAWLRWHAASPAGLASDRAWLTTVTTRLCLDALGSARARREAYVGPWVPEPLATDVSTAPALSRETLSSAFLLLLETLSPVERAVCLLREVFDHGHAEVAAIVGKEEGACRQLLHRAREHVRRARPRFAADRAAHQRLLEAFALTCATGDVPALRALLADDAVFLSDGGGKVSAARRPVCGADAVARGLIGIARKGAAGGATFEFAEVNAWPALVLRQAGRVTGVVMIECDDARVFAVHSVLNPDKLGAVGRGLGERVGA